MDLNCRFHENVEILQRYLIHSIHIFRPKHVMPHYFQRSTQLLWKDFLSSSNFYVTSHFETFLQCHFRFFRKYPAFIERFLVFLQFLCNQPLWAFYSVPLSIFPWFIINSRSKFRSVNFWLADHTMLTFLYGKKIFTWNRSWLQQVLADHYK